MHLNFFLIYMIKFPQCIYKTGYWNILKRIWRLIIWSSKKLHPPFITKLASTFSKIKMNYSNPKLSLPTAPSLSPDSTIAQMHTIILTTLLPPFVNDLHLRIASFISKIVSLDIRSVFQNNRGSLLADSWENFYHF